MNDINRPIAMETLDKLEEQIGLLLKEYMGCITALECAPRPEGRTPENFISIYQLWYDNMRTAALNKAKGEKPE